jgi:DNA-binding transcriptional ArsR family regulator
LRKEAAYMQGVETLRKLRRTPVSRRPAKGQVDLVLAALADPHRRRVVELLRERPCRAGELAAALGLNPPALSRHLRTLRHRGLVEESHPRFDARVRVYRLCLKPMEELRSWLQETERRWSNQLRAFKAHLERPIS